MTPQSGQHVKLLLRASITLEGIVEQWDEKLVILRSIDGERLLLVHSPGVDILLTTIMLSSKPEIKLPEINKQVIADQLKTVLQENDPELSKLNIQQLKNLVKTQEQKIIADKHKEHFGSAGSAKVAVPYSSSLDILKGK
jgi:hypothetical protein